MIYTMVINTENLYVDADVVIINLLKEEKKSSVDLSEVFRLCNFIEEQLKEQKYIERIRTVYFDVYFGAVERTVKYENYIFDLIGDKIYLKHAITPEIERNFRKQPILEEIIRDFVLSKKAS